MSISIGGEVSDATLVQHRITEQNGRQSEVNWFTFCPSPTIIGDTMSAAKRAKVEGDDAVASVNCALSFVL